MEDEPAPMPRRWFAVGAAIVLVFAAFVVLREFPPPPYHQSISYSVYVTAQEPTAFGILIPYPAEPNGTAAAWLSTMRVQTGGPGRFELRDSQHGPALFVEGLANISLFASGSASISEEAAHLGGRHPGGAADYNVWTTPESNESTGALGSVWVFVDPAHHNRTLQILLEISYNFGCYTEQRSSQWFVDAVDGWQEVPIERGAIVC